MLKIHENILQIEKKNKIDIMSKSCTNPINYESEKIFFFLYIKKEHQAVYGLQTLNLTEMHLACVR